MLHPINHQIFQTLIFMRLLSSYDFSTILCRKAILKAIFSYLCNSNSFVIVLSTNRIVHISTLSTKSTYILIYLFKVLWFQGYIGAVAVFTDKTNKALNLREF